MAFLLCLAFVSAAARADIPPPGSHSVLAKYWDSIDRWVTNYSPYSYSMPIADLISDNDGGVWFGVGPSLEHIDRGGRMSQRNMPEYLWDIFGFARDPGGRLWFSLGQSGRIGTIDPDGSLRTRVIVPRRFDPDIHEIAFDPDGILWFRDYGRGSIGRVSPDGDLLEIPIADRYETRFTLCGRHPYISTFRWDTDIGEIKSVDPRTLSIRTVKERAQRRYPICGKSGWSSGRSWLDHAIKRRDGTIAVQSYGLPIGYAEIAAVAASPNGDLWVALNYANAPLAITKLSKKRR